MKTAASGKSGEPWVGTNEIADHFGKPASFFENRAAELGIPRIRLGRQWRYRVSQVEAWFQSQEMSA